MAETLGIPACDKCDRLAAEMDELGMDGCRQQFARLVSEVSENALQMGNRLARLPGSVPLAVTVAISGGSKYEAVLKIAAGIDSIREAAQSSAKRRKRSGCC